MLLSNSEYKGAPGYLIGGQAQTIVPGIWRKITGLTYQRERITLSDGDFLDLDWIKKDNPKLIILSHGLEGNSTRQYMLGAAKYFSENNWDVLAWNCRSCSGTLNNTFKLYYHGDTADIESVINHAIGLDKYKEILLVGYSMGGSMLSKYLALKSNNCPSEIVGGVSFSAPYDLTASIAAVEKPTNWLYNYSFKSKLIRKIIAIDKKFPNKLDLQYLKVSTKWRDFDQAYSIKLNGFDNLDDFYESASCKNFLHTVKTPLLLVTALNDPIIPNTCINYEQIKRHKYVDIEYPAQGGHVGFTLGSLKNSWMELRVEQFYDGLS